MASFIAKARRKLGTWVQSRGPRAREFYLHFLSDPFYREEKIVGRGITEHLTHRSSEQDLYTLRRNIHMIEKGLTMRPRRPSFAVGYIRQTVNILEEALSKHTLQSGEAETNWVFAVLNEYFGATANATDREIRVAAENYRSALALKDYPVDESSSGPRPPSFEATSDHYLRLKEIAQGRRSVRWFRQAQPVSRDLVDRAVAIAAEGPTACNRQPYRFEIFDDPEDAARVAAVPMGTRGFGQQIPNIIVVVGDYSAFFDERDRHLIYIDGCLAAMGLVLALEAQGVATCCINWPDIVARDIEMRELIGLKKHEKVIMLIAYGYADTEGLAPASLKKPVATARRYAKL